jgi:prepilin-type processing-associated H-X9-DG protein
MSNIPCHAGKCSNSHRRLRAAFSLVELLVVIGIIMVLISLLMPAMSSVRLQAQELQCQANLRNIAMAAQLHVNDHAGRLPCGGWHWAPVGGICNPRGLGDPNARFFTYYDDRGERRPVPVTVALAVSLGIKVRLDSRENLEEDLQKDYLRKLFHCPSNDNPEVGLSQKEDGPRWEAPPEWSSYVFNEAVIGLRPADSWRDEPPLMGRVGRIRQPSMVMFAADGRPRDADTDDWLMVFDKAPDETLYDFQQLIEQTNNGFGKRLFDYSRHRFRMNVLFCDWHVQAVPMTEAGLKSVGVSKGIYR